MSALAVVRDITINTPPPGGGVSWGSGLVLAGGIAAAIAAVVAAIITARAAERRLEKTLEEERGRETQRLQSESKRIDKQLAHDRFLAERAEASAAVEHLARLIARNAIRVNRLSRRYLDGVDPTVGELKKVRRHFNEMEEVTNVAALRLGNGSPVVEAMHRLSKELDAALPWAYELPLSEERKAEIKKAHRRVEEAADRYLSEARSAIADFGLAQASPASSGSASIR